MQRRMWERGPDGQIVRVDLEKAAIKEARQSRKASPEGGTTKRARLGLALRLGLRDTYDYLGTVLLMSVLWTAAATTAVLGGQAVGISLFGRLPGYLPLFLSAVSALAGLVMVSGPLTAGFFRFARNAAAREEPELFDLAWGFRSALGRSLALAAAQVAGTVVLTVNCYYWLSQKHPAAIVLGTLFGYLLVFWGLLSLYSWPLLVEQELGTPRLLLKSFLLLLDNFLYTLLLALLCLLLSSLLWATMIAGALLWAGVMSMLLTQGTRELLRKYAILPPDPTLDPIAGESE